MASLPHDTLTGSHMKEHKDVELNSPTESHGSANQSIENAAEAHEELDSAKLEKKTTKASVNNISSIPNGGLRAWLQVLGVFFLFFNTW
jgi:hypothetical protein